MTKKTKYIRQHFDEDKARIFEALRALRNGDGDGADAAMAKLNPLPPSDNDEEGEQ